MRCCRRCARCSADARCWLRDWRHANDTIIGVLQVQKDTMFIVLGMIVLVAAFNVVSSLIMMVKDKTRDIAVLRTIGAGQLRGAAHLPDVRRVRRRHRHADRHGHRHRVLPQHRRDPACGGGHHRRPGVRFVGVHADRIARTRSTGATWRASWCSGWCCRCWRRCTQAGAPRAPIRWKRCGMSDPLRAARRAPHLSQRGRRAARAARRRSDAACRRDRRAGGAVGRRQVDAAASRGAAGKA